MRYAFADCVLDTDRRELDRAGEVLVLRPKVFQVLTYLIEHRDRVISKEELLEQCWPGRVVSEATLSTCMKHVRVALGDSGSEQKCIKTLHGHGFHFVAPLLDEESAAAGDGPGAAGDDSLPRVAEREFKQVSVLACAVSDADRLSENLGPESMDALMRGFFASARVVLSRYGGTVTQWQGDGFTALFGAPLAFEDHARRAALAAVELRDVLSSASDRGVSLSAGLHSGEVVVGALDESEQLFTAVGPTTAVANRIRDAADGSILASSDLYRLIEIDVEGGEEISSSGLPRLYSIAGVIRARGGVPRRAGRKLSQFVGRDDEMSIVRKRLSRAEDGLGQVVCASGEPGIGKSWHTASPRRICRCCSWSRRHVV
jgi:class 3 adenylate cyclase